MDASSPAKAPRVSPDEAKRLVDEEGYRYLDVRTVEEFAAGHPEGSHNIPFRVVTAAGTEKNPDFLPMALAVYPQDTPLVVGCKAGVISVKAASELLAAGFTRVVEQRAGLEGARNAFGQVTEPGWRQRGFPVVQRTEGGSYVELKGKL